MLQKKKEKKENSHFELVSVFFLNFAFNIDVDVNNFF